MHTFRFPATNHHSLKNEREQYKVLIAVQSGRQQDLALFAATTSPGSITLSLYQYQNTEPVG
jgi:hypothetical protein